MTGRKDAYFVCSATDVLLPIVERAFLPPLGADGSLPESRRATHSIYREKPSEHHRRGGFGGTEPHQNREDVFV